MTNKTVKFNRELINTLLGIPSGYTIGDPEYDYVSIPIVKRDETEPDSLEGVDMILQDESAYYNILKHNILDHNIIYVDIDHTVLDYPRDVVEGELFMDKAVAKPHMIKLFNRLFAVGKTIVYYSSRGNELAHHYSPDEWIELTKKQLDSHGILYSDVRVDKPKWDILIDDKCINIDLIHMAFNRKK